MIDLDRITFCLPLMPRRYFRCLRRNRAGHDRRLAPPLQRLAVAEIGGNEAGQRPYSAPRVRLARERRSSCKFYSIFRIQTASFPPIGRFVFDFSHTIGLFPFNNQECIRFFAYNGLGAKRSDHFLPLTCVLASTVPIEIAPIRDLPLQDLPLPDLPLIEVCASWIGSHRTFRSKDGCSSQLTSLLPVKLGVSNTSKGETVRPRLLFFFPLSESFNAINFLSLPRR